MTSQNHENILDKFTHSKEKWVKIDAKAKIEYLKKCSDNLQNYAHEWVEISVKNKGIPSDSQVQGQEWIAGPGVVMRALNLLKKKYLGHLVAYKPQKTFWGGFKVKVMPTDNYDRLIYQGINADIIFQDGKSDETYIQQDFLNGQISFILGAGNVSSIAPLDALDKLFLFSQVCIIKLNPVNEYLYDVFTKIFKPLIDDDFLCFVKGGADVGAQYCYDARVDNVHITGSHLTHNAIVWGDPKDPQTEVRRQNNKPLLKKEITSELGCVTPVIVVPGNWTDKEVDYQTKQIISAVENNASFNCNAAKVVILDKNWNLKDKFLLKLKENLFKARQRNAYYPGAFNRYKEFLKHYPNAIVDEQESQNCIPWTLIPNVNLDQSEYALSHEAFCTILATVEIESENIPSYLNKAVAACNEKIWGTLSCMMLIDPKTQKQNKKSYQAALKDLKYGSIGVNCWAALSYALYTSTWGAYPGHTLHDPMSGIGCVHNAYNYKYPEKSIITCPFVMKIKPVWFYDHKNLIEVGQNLVKFEHTRNFINFTKLAFASFKG